MLKKKETILESLGKELPNMTEARKNYLLGWLEGFSAYNYREISRREVKKCAIQESRRRQDRQDPRG